ncbi:MAG: CooT family nickel-binding protein [Eubacteriales bacterium]|nr:CooT family nickel-binding protein [Eubacteriales bacterium]
MCLSTVVKAGQPENVILEYVSKITIDGDRITLTDVMGEQKTVVGSIRLADLTGGRVEINCQ